MLLLHFRWPDSWIHPLLLTTTCQLTMLVTHLLVFLTDVTKYTLIHIQQTLPQSSSLLLDTKVLHHTMLVSSTAHTFHCKWFVQLVRTHSSQKLVSRHVMVLLQTHLLVVLQSEVVQSLLTTTYITEEFKLRTSCNNKKNWIKPILGRTFGFSLFLLAI